MAVMVPKWALDVDSRTKLVELYVEHQKVSRSVPPIKWSLFPVISMHSRAWTKYRGESRIHRSLLTKSEKDISEMNSALESLAGFIGEKKRHIFDDSIINMKLPTVVLNPLYFQTSTGRVVYRMAWGEAIGAKYTAVDVTKWHLYLSDGSPDSLDGDDIVGVASRNSVAAFDYAESKARRAVKNRGSMFRLMMLADMNPPKQSSTEEYFRHYYLDVLYSIRKYNSMLLLFS